MLKSTLTQYFSIFLAVLFVVSGNGLLSMYFPIFAKVKITASEIGLITSAYYFGFFLGCIKVIDLIRRVGFVRAFMFVITLIGVCSLLFTMAKSTFLWFPLRFVMGFGYAGLYVVIESWINSLVQNEDRGRVYGTYRFIDLASMAIGQNIIVFLEGMTGHYHFSMVALLTFLSVIPLSLTLLPQPHISSEKVSLNVKRLWENSQFSTGLMILIGMSNSVIWMLTPLLLLDKGIAEESIPNIFFFFVLGGILSQYPIGILSDRVERRSIINTLSFVTIGISFAFSLKQYFSFQPMILFFALGIFVMPLYSLVMTHAMDKADPSNSSRISSQMLLLFSIGAIIGPVTCGLFIKFFKSDGYAFFLITLYVVMFIFGMVQRLTHEPVEEDDKAEFKVFPESSPIILLSRKLRSKNKNT